MTTWLDTEAGWADLAADAERSGAPVGWDTETYGHNVKESSPAFRARVDVWSLGVARWRRGVTAAPVYEGYVLPADALRRGPLRALLESPRVVKVAHNARHDLHAAANEGVTVAGVTDTLETARLAYPGLPSYTLKALRVAVLGKPAREGFRDLTRPEPVRRDRARVVCVCGKSGCRRKSEGHVQWTETVTTWTKGVPVPVEAIVPGHPRWTEKLEYAAEDAVDAPELWWALRARVDRLATTLPPLPWEAPCT